MLPNRVCISVYPEEMEILKKKDRDWGLPLSRFLVLKALNKLGGN